MSAVVFLSPSDQNSNPVVGGGSERDLQRAAASKCAWYLGRCPGISVIVGADLDPNVDEYPARVAASNAAGANIHVCFHSNAGEGGTLMLCYNSDDSRELATDIFKFLAPLTPSKDPGLRDGSEFYELNGTTAVATLIEVDRHDTAEGAALIRRLIADDTYPLAVAHGIVDFAVAAGLIDRPRDGFFSGAARGQFLSLAQAGGIAKTPAPQPPKSAPASQGASSIAAAYAALGQGVNGIAASYAALGAALKSGGML